MRDGYTSGRRSARSGSSIRNSSTRSSGNSSRILYDARGVRVKSSPLSNKYLRILLFYVLPYLVINGIILLLVCSTPSITVKVNDTNDYLTADVEFTVKSLLPLKELNVSLESEEVAYERDGSSYSCTVNKNGTFTVEAKSLNGMSHSSFTDISMLDDTAPSVDESSINYSRGVMTFNINDTQSGVNYDSIYGTLDDGETIYPSDYDKELGLVTMKIPTMAESIDLHFEDMVGNAREGRISLSLSAEDGTGESESSSAEGESSSSAEDENSGSTES